MRGSARFGRARSREGLPARGFVAPAGGTRAREGFAWMECSRTSDMNATQTAVVRIADRLNAPEADSVAGVAGFMSETGRRARGAARRLATASAEEKNAALSAMAEAIRATASTI